MGLVNLTLLTNSKKYCNARDKVLDLLMNIQDQSQEPYLHGCWRGMYDMNKKQWGGGDFYEGGSNSIYTGWTNAPISIAFATVLSSSCYGNIFPDKSQNQTRYPR